MSNADAVYLPELLAGIAGGCGLFIIGMWVLTENLRSLAGRRLRRIAGRWTSNRLSALLWGCLAGGITQSMAALTFIVVGLLRSGLISTQSGLALVLGGGAGVTVLVFVVTFDIKMIALYVLGLGGVAIVSERLASRRPAMFVVLGGALLILGLVLLKESAAPLANEPWFSEMIESTGQSLVLAFFVGAFLTCLVQSSGVVTVFGISLATIGIVSVDQALMNMYGSLTGSSTIIYLLSLNLVGRERQVAMYVIIYNMVTCATVVTMLYIEIYLGVPLIKAMMSSTGLDLGRQLSLVYIFICIFLIPVMLVLLNWSAVQLDRIWPASQTDELSRPRFIHDHASVDVDTSLLLVDLEQQRALKNVAQYLEAVRNGESVRDLQAASQSLLMEIEYFLDDLHVVHPMHDIEEQNSLRTRQKLLFWMKDTLGLLCESLISIPEDSALSRLRIIIHEGVDTVMVSLIYVMEDNDSGSWKLLRQLVGDRGNLMQNIRSQLIQARPPPSSSELAQVLRITNLVEETFFLLTKLVQEFAKDQTEIVQRKIH